MSDQDAPRRRPEVRWPRGTLVAVGVLVAGAAAVRLALPTDPFVRAVAAWTLALTPILALVGPAGSRGVAYGAVVGLAALLAAEFAAGFLPEPTRDWPRFVLSASLYSAFTLGAVLGTTLRDREWMRSPKDRRSLLARLRGLLPGGRDTEEAGAEPYDPDDEVSPLPREETEQRLVELLRRAEREGEPLSVIAFGVEGIGAQPAEVRREVWKAMHDQIDREDVLGRLGPARFLAILPGLTSGRASVVAERVRANVAPLSPDGGPAPVLSAGIAAAERGGSRPSEILAQAESALDQARRLGGDRIMLNEGGVFREGPVRPAFES